MHKEVQTATSLKHLEITDLDVKEFVDLSKVEVTKVVNQGALVASLFVNWVSAFESKLALMSGGGGAVKKHK